MGRLVVFAQHTIIVHHEALKRRGGHNRFSKVAMAHVHPGCASRDSVYGLERLADDSEMSAVAPLFSLVMRSFKLDFITCHSRRRQ